MSTSWGPLPSSGGEIAVMAVPAAFTVKLSAGMPPNSTSVAPRRLCPVTVTLVLPPAAPVAGLTFVTSGAGTAT